MDFEFLFRSLATKQPAPDYLVVGEQRLLLRFVRHRRARRYILRLTPDLIARVVIPRGGSMGEAAAFARANTAWLQRQLVRHMANPGRPQAWHHGTQILFRGDWVTLTVDGPDGSGPCVVRFADHALKIPDRQADLRPHVERHLWQLAAQELPDRVVEFARAHGFAIHKVCVRNQRSRWGSCSRRGTISLNWRLLQGPAFVRDYIILHELAHFRKMNHSGGFWREVERLCPEFSAAEKWLKQHSNLLR